jgi:hypothetical protein
MRPSDHTSSRFYCAGNIAGPHLFLGQKAPRYHTAIKGLIAAYGICMVLQAAYTTLCFLQNKSRDRKHQHVAEVQEALEGFEDLTDWRTYTSDIKSKEFGIEAPTRSCLGRISWRRHFLLI